MTQYKHVVVKSNATISNSRFVENLPLAGHALTCDSRWWYYPSNLRISNCIFWDGGNEIWNNDNSTITITYSDIQRGYEGQGNIDADPCFVEPGYWDVNDLWVDGDYHLFPRFTVYRCRRPELHSRTQRSRPRWQSSCQWGCNRYGRLRVQSAGRGCDAAYAADAKLPQQRQMD